MSGETLLTAAFGKNRESVVRDEKNVMFVDLNQDSLPPITVGLYRAFLARGKVGIPALLVYQFLLYTYRWQHTDQIWATNRYISKGLCMDHRTVNAAKKLLGEMGIIRTVQEKGEHGYWGKTYIQLNLLPNPGPAAEEKTAPVEQSTAGTKMYPRTAGTFHRMPSNATNCLKKKSKCLKKKDTAAVAAALVTPKTSHRNNSTEGKKNPQPLITDLFHKKYAVRPGGKPPWGAKEGKLLKDDLARLGVDALATYVDLFFNGAPRSVVDFALQAGWTYGVFHSQIPKLEAAAAEELASRSLLRTCPNCGREQEHTGADCVGCRKPLKEAVHAG